MHKEVIVKRLAFILVVISLMVGSTRCSEGTIPPPASPSDTVEKTGIQETVAHFWDAFGLHDYTRCLSSAAVQNEEEATNTLGALYDTLLDVTRTENVDSTDVSGLSATARVTLSTQVAGQILTVRTPLVKQDGKWKVVLEEITLISESFMPTDVKATAAQVCSDYETNRIAASMKYENRKLVEVEGKVLRVKRSDFGDISQLMLGDCKIKHGDCFFRGRDKSQVPIGDTVSVRGFVQDGLIYPSSGEIQILMGGCSLVK